MGMASPYSAVYSLAHYIQVHYDYRSCHVAVIQTLSL